MKARAILFLLVAGALARPGRAVTYTQDVKPLLDAHCVECHVAEADLDLSRYPFKSSDLTDMPSIVSRILERIEASPPQMPPGNRPKLSAGEVNVIREWRDGGLLP